MRTLCSVVKSIFNSIKKTGDKNPLQSKETIEKARNTQSKNGYNNKKSKKLFIVPGNYSIKSIQRKNTYKGEETIKGDENLTEQIAPETCPTKSVQVNQKKFNKYEEMIKDNKNSRPMVTPTKPMELRMMHGICSTCHKELEAADWCKVCEIEKFRQNFKNWTSGNPEIDELIRKSQLNATDALDYLEWIDNKEIMDIEYIIKGEFGKIFKGIWINGPKHKIDSVKRTWKNVPNKIIALKEIKFLDEVRNHQKFLRNRENHVLRCLGITKSPGDDVEATRWLKREKHANRPKSNSYMMVMVWANDGNLFDYTEKRAYDKNFTWYKRLEILEALSDALENIHSKKMIHHNLHCGNILMNDQDKFQFPAISNLKLCGNYSQTGVLNNVLAFIAPELLRRNSEPFTTASDIYSFGVIMWVICSCKLPYGESDSLQLRIIQGFRPNVSKDIPTTYADLMKRCWDDDPERRPKALELRNIFSKWKKQYHSDNNEFFIAEKERLDRIIFDNALEKREI